MYKIAITSRINSQQYFFNISYYQFLSSHFYIEFVLPRNNLFYEDIVNRNDALLITGGDDINSIYYHESLDSSTVLENQTIESLDFCLLHHFYKAHKPIFGICRGMQIINVFFKGSLYQDIDNHRKAHMTTILPHTFLSKYFPQSIKTNSFHHQSLNKIPSIFTINAISNDGIIEGIENSHIIAVQWHPEKMNQSHQQSFIQMMNDFIFIFLK